MLVSCLGFPFQFRSGCGWGMWNRWARGGLLTLSGILAFSLLYILATRSESVPPPGTASSEALERADAGIQNFRFVQSEAGTVKWEVRARRARLFEGEGRALLEDVHVNLFGPQGRELRLAGEEGAIDMTRKDFTLAQRNGTLAVVLESGYTVYTNHLVWSEEQRVIRTGDPVTIVGHGLEVKGKGLLGKLDSEEFEVLEDVRVEIVQ